MIAVIAAVALVCILIGAAAALLGPGQSPVASPPPATAEASPSATAEASPPATAEASPSATAEASPSATGVVAEAKAIVETLPVKGRAPMTGYDRDEQFGSAWRDTDANGCDTRNDILQRDLHQVQMRDECIVEQGLLDDPYSGSIIGFVRGPGTSSEVQIDHVVALANAWQTGAQQLTYEERVSLANDPLDLLAVDGGLNQQKGAGDAATWLPPNRSFRCEYVSLQVLVKDRWELWLTPPEKEAILRVLSAC